MSTFLINVIAVNPQQEERSTLPMEAIVDSGAEISWFPANELRGAGILPRREGKLATATGQVITRPIGYAILRVDGYETIDEVVFGEPSDAVLLGVRSLEGFGVTVDFIGHRLIARTHLAV